MSCDPREVEMLAIINMQPVPDEVLEKIHNLETTTNSKFVDPNDVFLKPGMKIRPEVEVQDARRLAERLYGIVANEITELISYDDRNFLIISDRNVKNPIIANQWPHGYILKIQNSLDSKKVSFIDAQTQLMMFLGQQNIVCPRPVMNINGKYFSLERFGESTNSVRLLEFVPGQIFYQVPVKTNHLFYQAGQYLGSIDNALKHFKHDAYATHRTLWQLDSLPHLSEFVFALRDEAKQEIVEQVLKQFDRDVLQHYDLFDKGIIHGDFNEQNILVKEDPSNSNDFRVSGILDFGDTSYSCYVFEVAIAMAYMILQAEDIAIGGLVLAGYGMVRSIPEHEKSVLKVCVAARLCQSLVLGAYSHTQDPDNTYVLTTQALGWELLDKLWAEPDKKLIDLWTETANKYLTQSSK